MTLHASAIQVTIKPSRPSQVTIRLRPKRPGDDPLEVAFETPRCAIGVSRIWRREIEAARNAVFY